MRLMPALLAATALLSGCVSAPSTKPAVRAIDGGTLGLDAASQPAIADDWWTALRDPQLNRIMQDALAGNPSLDAALARIRQAEAGVSSERAQGLPQINLDVNEQRQRLSEKYIIPPPYGGSTQWVGTVQAGLQWNLDFWGRRAALIGQARATAQAVALDHDAARLALTGAVAQSYVELARAERQLDIATRFVTAREQQLELARIRIRSQIASRFDERTAETLLAQARQATVLATGARALAVHALATLAGRGADYYGGIGHTRMVLDGATALPASLPADLLGRRPDVLAALERVDAAAAGRKVARTAFYPNINLVGLVGLQALGLGPLFTSGAGVYGGGAAVHLPIFDGGRIRADYAGATAALDVAVANYNEALLRAVHEAADAITQVDTARANAAEQRRLLTGYRDIVQLNQTRIQSGLGSQLDILSAGDRVLAAEQQLADIDANTAIQRVRLIIALGGGFDPRADMQTSAARTPGAVNAEARP